MIELPELPWAEDALEPHLSKKIIHYHYDKRHRSYVDNLNKLIKNTEFEHMDLNEIIKKSGTGPIYNNSLQIKNHTFFWYSMVPTSKYDENSSIGKAITEDFGSYEKFEKEFHEKAKKLFGSGYIWLTYYNKTGKLTIQVTKNAHQPDEGHTPILTCDLWEHSHELDYPADRPGYVKAFFKVIDWNYANNNLKNV